MGVSSGTTTSGLRGLVTRGPITPVCLEDQPCDKPAANVRLFFVRGGRQIASVRTARDGTYRLTLAPGSYGVRLAQRPVLGQFVSPAKVLVLRGRYRHVDFHIDTGIR
jgi:hypothetical protein